MPVKTVGQKTGLPRETLESGDNMVIRADGGGPFQAYGPYPAGTKPEMDGPNEGWLGDAGRDEFAGTPQGSWPGDKIRKRPIRQIVDDGGNS